MKCIKCQSLRVETENFEHCWIGHHICSECTEKMAMSVCLDCGSNQLEAYREKHNLKQ